MSAERPAFDPKTVKLLSAHEVPGILFALAFDEASKTLFGAGMDGALWTLDVAAEKPTAQKRWAVHENYVSGLVLHEDLVISAGYDQQLIWSDRNTGKRVRALKAHDGWVRRLVRSPDGKRLLTVGDDMLVKLWDTANGKLLLSLAGHEQRTPEGYLSGLYALAVSADGACAASADRSGFVCIWDLKAGFFFNTSRTPEFYTFDPQKRLRAIGGIRGLAFSADGTKLAISGIGAVTNVDGFVGPCRMELWDWKATKRLSFGQDKHQAILNQVTFGPTPDWLIGAGGGDGGGALMFWKADSSTPPHVAKPKGHLQAFAVNADRTHLYAVGHGGFQTWQLSVSS